MNGIQPDRVDLHTVSPLNLAFVGDAVFELLVRQRLVANANRPNAELHKLSVEQVCASAQAAALDRIWPMLTEREQAVFRRGRNAHTSRTGGDYHKATGLEALFGYLYFQGESERIRALFDATTKDL